MLLDLLVDIFFLFFDQELCVNLNEPLNESLSRGKLLIHLSTHAFIWGSSLLWSLLLFHVRLDYVFENDVFNSLIWSLVHQLVPELIRLLQVTNHFFMHGYFLVSFNQLLSLLWYFVFEYLLEHRVPIKVPKNTGSYPLVESGHFDYFLSA